MPVVSTFFIRIQCFHLILLEYAILLIFIRPVAKVRNKQKCKESLRRGRVLSEAQIVDSRDDIEAEMQFFSEISISRAQDFKFFELSKNMLDKNAFGRKCCIMSFLLWSKRDFSPSFVWQKGLRMKFLKSLITRIGKHCCVTWHMIRHFSNFKIMSFSVVTL